MFAPATGGRSSVGSTYVIRRRLAGRRALALGRLAGARRRCETSITDASRETFCNFLLIREPNGPFERLIFHGHQLDGPWQLQQSPTGGVLSVGRCGGRDRKGNLCLLPHEGAMPRIRNRKPCGSRSVGRCLRAPAPPHHQGTTSGARCRFVLARCRRSNSAAFTLKTDWCRLRRAGTRRFRRTGSNRDQESQRQRSGG